MSEQNNCVVSIRDLVLGVKDDESTQNEFRFKIEYGSFDINADDFVLIKGRNGSGKSTFLRLFHLQGANYFEFLNGGAYFYGEGCPNTSIQNYSIDEKSHLNRVVSFIEQEDRFLSSDSAYSYIYNLCKIALNDNKSLSLSQKRERLREVDSVIFEYYEKYLAKSFQCKSYKTFKNKNVRAWSGGQKKMINVLAGIIKAKICSLKLLIMDEPLNNLDGRNKDILNKLIGELRNAGVAILAITHCQIFDGVNKVLNITEDGDGVHRATLINQCEPAHSECLECYN